MFLLIAAIFEKLDTYILCKLCFPFPIEHIGLSQHISAVLPRVSFAKVKPVLIIASKSFCAFLYYKFRYTCTDGISYYVEINSTSNLVFHFSFVILRFLVKIWWFSDTEFMQTVRRFIWKKFESFSRDEFFEILFLWFLYIYICLENPICVPIRQE